MKSPVTLVCPEHNSDLILDKLQESYTCPSGCIFPIINGIPRFVALNNYASSFGLQWNVFQKTQLDSYTGVSISRDRLTRLIGGSLDILKGKDVLEAGCGAGRFTEIMLEAGARVFAVDISIAVDANYDNCGKFENYFVTQGDILKIPARPEQFDIVVCIGVIQHTPNSEDTMRALCSYVKPGGLLVIDHYTYGYAITLSRSLIRSFLIKRTSNFSMKFCKMMVSCLWPIHRLLWRYRKLRSVSRIRSQFLRYSPVVDYHDAYPQLTPQLLYAWALLDTHDTLTDFYKHLRSAEEIKLHLHQCGMTEIEAIYAGNGVEARAKKPS